MTDEHLQWLVKSIQQVLDGLIKESRKRAYMTDIIRCKDHECPMKDKCYRFASVEGGSESYFAESPKQIKDGEFHCSMLWLDGNQILMEQLKNIINGNQI